jgi:hypothetical protein
LRFLITGTKAFLKVVVWRGVSPFSSHFQEATNELVETMKSKLGHKSADPYLLFCRHMYEMHDGRNDFPTDKQARLFTQLYNACRIATWSYAVVTRQSGAFENLILAIATGAASQNGEQQNTLSVAKALKASTDTNHANRDIPEKGKRGPDLRIRKLIDEAIQSGKTDEKSIQAYVQDVTGEKDRKVHRRTISEVRKRRRAEGK